MVGRGHGRARACPEEDGQRPRGSAYLTAGNILAFFFFELSSRFSGLRDDYYSPQDRHVRHNNDNSLTTAGTRGSAAFYGPDGSGPHHDRAPRDNGVNRIGNLSRYLPLIQVTSSSCMLGLSAPQQASTASHHQAMEL